MSSMPLMQSKQVLSAFKNIMSMSHNLPKSPRAPVPCLKSCRPHFCDVQAGYYRLLPGHNRSLPGICATNQHREMQILLKDYLDFQWLARKRCIAFAGIRSQQKGKRESRELKTRGFHTSRKAEENKKNPEQNEIAETNGDANIPNKHTLRPVSLIYHTISSQN